MMMRVHLPKKWHAADLTGRAISLMHHASFAACDHGGAPGFSTEPAVIAQRVLRDDMGSILFYSGLSAPTTENGQVLYAQELVPELRLRWRESEHRCEWQRHELLLEANGVEVAAARWAEAVPLELDGSSYTLRAFGVGRPPEKEGHCGSSSFALYRNDFLSPPE